MEKNIILICKRVKFYDMRDEEAFFEWIKKIKPIKKIDGIYDELYLYFATNNIPDKSLRSLIALFYRYNINMKQLAIFLNEKNKKWFKLYKNAYWHTKIFEKKMSLSEASPIIRDALLNKNIGALRKIKKTLKKNSYTEQGISKKISEIKNLLIQKGEFPG